jgi:hypothetical protein
MRARVEGPVSTTTPEKSRAGIIVEGWRIPSSCSSDLVTVMETKPPRRGALSDALC